MILKTMTLAGAAVAAIAAGSATPAFAAPQTVQSNAVTRLSAPSDGDALSDQRAENNFLRSRPKREIDNSFTGAVIDGAPFSGLGLGLGGFNRRGFF